MSYDKDSEGKKLMRINREVPFLSYPSWKLHSKRLFTEPLGKAQCQRYLPRSGEFRTIHVCLSFTNRIKKFQQCFCKNIPHSTTPQRHIALLGIIAALSRDFSLPSISITREVSGQSWHFQGSFN